MPVLNLNPTNVLALNDSALAVASEGLIVQTYCNQIQQQPLMPTITAIEGFGQLDTHLRTAQTNAGTYLTSVQPDIIKVITDLGGYAKQFPIFVTGIDAALAKWKKTHDESDKEDMLQLLLALKNDVDKRQQNVSNVQRSIGNTITLFNTDISHFTEFVNLSHTRITGDTGELESIETQISNLNGQIRDKSIALGMSSLALIGGVISIIVGVFASVPTGGASTVLIIGGAMLVVTGAAGIILSSLSLANMIAEKGALLRRKGNISSELTLMNACNSTLTDIRDSAKNAGDSLTNMNTTWRLLSGELEVVIGSIDSAREPSQVPLVVQSYLTSARENWSSVDNSIKVVKEQMSGVQTVKLQDNSGNLLDLNEQNIRARLPGFAS